MKLFGLSMCAMALGLATLAIADETSFLEETKDEFSIESRTLVDIVESICREYNVLYSVEEYHKLPAGEATLRSGELISINLRNSTVREILDALALKTGSFYWLYGHGLLNIVAKKYQNDPEYPMNVEIDQLSFVGSRFALIEKLREYVPSLAHYVPKQLFLGQERDFFVDADVIELQVECSTIRNILNLAAIKEHMKWSSKNLKDGKYEVLFSSPVRAGSEPKPKIYFP